MKDARWDGHHVMDALRETRCVRVTFACGGVAVIPVPLPPDHTARSRAPVDCLGCVRDAVQSVLRSRPGRT